MADDPQPVEGPTVPVEKWFADVPADAAEFLDGEPPLRLEELAPAKRKAVEGQLAAKAKQRTPAASS